MVLQGIADKVSAHIEYNFGRMSRQPSSVENNKISAKPIQLIYFWPPTKRHGIVISVAYVYV